MRCLADTGGSDTVSGQLEVEFMRWTLALTGGPSEMPETLKDGIIREFILARSGCGMDDVVRSVFQSPAVRDQQGHRRLASVARLVVSCGKQKRAC